MYLREIKSSPALTSFFRCYRIIDFEFPNHDPIPPKAYTPRPEQCLQFFPTPTIIDCSDKGERIRPKNGLLIGRPTVMNKRTVFKKFLSLQTVDNVKPYTVKKGDKRIIIIYLHQTIEIARQQTIEIARQQTIEIIRQQTIEIAQQQTIELTQ